MASINELSTVILGENEMPKAIDRVVVIQAFLRDPRDFNMLDEDTLHKYVGTLESYMETSTFFEFHLKGGRKVRILKKSQYVEVYLYDPKTDIYLHQNIRKGSTYSEDGDEIVFQTREDADRVLAALKDLLVKYGRATFSDFYDLVGITPKFTDTKWGWVDLGYANVRQTAGGYKVVLPQAIEV
jgi:hypothetical protein